MKIQEKFDLTGKVALITGASKGIGLAMATAMGQAGAKVVISSRKQEALDEVANKMRAEGIDVHPIAGIIGNSESMRKLVDEVISKYEAIDILVNNAAINPVFGPVLDTDEAAFDKIMQVNVKGPFELAKMVYPSMVSRGGGSIINISSIGGLTPEAMLGIYSVSKSALISLTKVMAKEWGQVGIRANVICPGLIKTKFSEALWSNEKILNSVMRKQPLNMLAEPEDVAGLALLLGSPAGAFCSGGVYTADGGYTI
ncbi:MAG: short-chain dehydrogenase [Bacteroidetes bacterium]|nr:MAG: short-chain dehydrogenase [Bacteroidota bacterium]